MPAARRPSRKRSTKTIPAAATPNATSARSVPTTQPYRRGRGRTSVSSTTSAPCGFALGGGDGYGEGAGNGAGERITTVGCGAALAGAGRIGGGCAAGGDIAGPVGAAGNAARG